MEKKSQLHVLLSVLATGIMIFCGMVIETSMNIVFPTLMKQFNISTSIVQWMTTSYLLVVSIIVPISAYLREQFKTKNLFIFAIIFFTCGVLIDCFANSFTLLLSGRIIQGIGTGVALPLMFNIIIDEVPKEKLGLMMAIGTLVTAVGPAVGPTLGGIISYYLNWHYIFIFLVPLLIIAFFLGIINIHQSVELKKKPFNFHNFIFIPIMFMGLILGLNNISKYGLFATPTIVPLIIGIIGIIGFILSSIKFQNPLINIEIFKDSDFNKHVISFMLIQMTLLGLGFLLPNFTQIVLKHNELIAALQLLGGAIVGAIFTIFAGRILDNIGPSIPIKGGTALVVFALLSFSLAIKFLSVPLIVLIYIAFMLGVGLALGNIMTNGIDLAANDLKADANAVFNVIQQFSGALGTTIASTIVGLVQTGKIGSITYTATTSAGTEYAFIVFLGFTFIAACLMWKEFSNK